VLHIAKKNGNRGYLLDKGNLAAYAEDNRLQKAYLRGLHICGKDLPSVFATIN
jgi:hypothetical protein